MPCEFTTFNVEGMSCSHCEQSIKNAIEILNGVSNVIIDLGEKKVIVEYDDELISVETIKDKIKDQGYQVK